jgi:hypothetical protein
MSKAKGARLGAVLLLFACQFGPIGPVLLRAQVGHDPARSPYRDIGGGTFLTLVGGYLSGDGGRVGVAPHGGPLGGVRVSFLSNRTIRLGAGVLYGSQDRNLIDPNKTPSEQLTGTAKVNTWWIEGSLQFNLTGNKTWHGLAPFAGSGVGLTITETLPQDPGAFRMGTKFFLAPTIGTRFFLTPRVYLEADARFQFWQISYPATFRQEPFEDPGTLTDPHAVIPDGRLKEWSVSPWLNFGLGVPFRLPF